MADGGEWVSGALVPGVGFRTVWVPHSDTEAEASRTGLMTINAAATALGRSRDFVVRAVKNGHLRSQYWLGKDWIARASVVESIRSQGIPSPEAQHLEALEESGQLQEAARYRQQLQDEQCARNAAGLGPEPAEKTPYERIAEGATLVDFLREFEGEGLIMTKSLETTGFDRGLIGYDDFDSPAGTLARSMGYRRERVTRDTRGELDISRFLSLSMSHEALATFGGNSKPFEEAAKRTGISYFGPSYGFTLPQDVGTRVIDRARSLSAVWGLCRWIPTTTREWLCPVVAEKSRALGSRFGGLTSAQGLGELNMPAASDGKTGRVNFLNRRTLLTCNISRDLFEDAMSLRFWLEEAAYKEISANIENAVVNGNPPSGFGGLINNPATVVIAKGSTPSNEISAANIDAMWGAIPEANSYNSIWLCNKQTEIYISGLAAVYPQINYLPPPMTGGKWSTLKGKPLVYSEFSPALGNPGDLIVFDPTDWLFTYMPLDKLTTSPLAWSAGIDYIAVNNEKIDPNKTGMLSLPEGALEQRMSSELFFVTDIIACAWKLRCDFNTIWNSTITGANGGTYGPCAITAQR